MTGRAARRANLVPHRYRGVSVARLPAGADPEAIPGQLLGRPAYRRTRYVVVRSGAATMLLEVDRSSAAELFAPIVAAKLLAGPDECAYLVEPTADVGIPSVLADLARRRAPHARAVVVRGRYGHVNFIVDPRPVRVVVCEIVPPEPAKLLDQARRVLAVTETLPPIELVGELTELRALAARRPDRHYLLPCRAGGGEIPGAQVSYLDEHPPRAEWTLLGCTRSRQIHRCFYGDEPPTVDFCPKRAVVGRAPAHHGAALLTKCCLQEEQVQTGPGWASVPWGASLDQVREALVALVTAREPTWAPG